MSYICEYCKGSFTTKSVLFQHQKKARYCLDIQLKINPETIIETIPCQYCNKNFTRNHDKNVHESVCKNNKNNDPSFVECEKKLKEKDVECEKYTNKIKLEYEKYTNKIKLECEKKIKEKDDEINEIRIKFEIVNSKLESEISKREIYKELHASSKECVEKIASQPKNVSNNNTINIPTFNINQEDLSQAANTNFTRDHFLQGQAGAAKFFIEYIKESNNGIVPFVVSDKSREVIKYKNKNQEIVIDNKVNKISQLAYDAIKNRNQEHYDSFYSNRKNDDSDNEEDEEDDSTQELADKCFISIKKLPKDNTIFRKKIIESCK
jgi:hypothetical protein